MGKFFPAIKAFAFFWAAVIAFAVPPAGLPAYSGETVETVETCETCEADEPGENGETKDFVAVAFTGENYAGVSWAIPSVGDYDLWEGFGLPNDSVCSIRVRPGFKVTIYEHSKFGGDSEVLDADSSGLGERNRWASSLKVEANEGRDDDPAWKDGAAKAGEVNKWPGGEADPKQIRKFRRMFETQWYGETTDDERIETGETLLGVFEAMGYDVSDWLPHTFAQQLNNFFDWRKSMSVWETACLILNVDPAAGADQDMAAVLQVAARASGMGGSGKGASGNGFENGFRMKDGRVFKNGREIECEVNEVPSGMEGPVRFWSVLGSETDDAVTEAETGVWFFSSGGASLAFAPLESEHSFQGIFFSPDGGIPDGGRFVLQTGSGMRPDLFFEAYAYGEATEKIAEFAGIRGELAWIDPARFVFTRIDDARETEDGVFDLDALRLSVVMFDAAADETTVLKEATDTQNFRFGEIVEDGDALMATEESVGSEKDRGGEKKTESREIRIKIPAAG